MAQTRGKWLGQQRQARGWNVPQMARQLRQAAASAGDTLPAHDGLLVMIRRWECDGSGISERYRLHYCTAFAIPAGWFGDPAAPIPPRAAVRDAAGEITEVPRGASPAAAPASLPARILAVLEEPGDPARRDQLSFLLGYVSALMTTLTPRQAP